MDEEHTPTAGELDEQRRGVIARTLRAWIVEHERLKACGADTATTATAATAGCLDALTAEVLGLLVRLQVCRGLTAAAVAADLAGSLAMFAAHYGECAAWPNAAERELDAARAATFRDLAALPGGGTPPPEALEDRRN